MITTTKAASNTPRIGLRASASTLALAAMFVAVPLQEVRAQSICSDFTPASSTTVTCTFDTQAGGAGAQPITTAIFAPGATGVTLDIEDAIDRQLDDTAVLFTAQPVISLGAGASIDVQNADISNVDLSGDLVGFDQALFAQGITDANDLVQALVDAGIPASLGVDDDGDEFIELENDADIVAANVVFSGLFADSDRAVIELGAPGSINDIDVATLTAIATSPGLNSAAADPNGNFLNLGRLDGLSADVDALGAVAIQQASGGAASIQLLASDVAAFGSNGAAVLLDASDGRGGAVEVSLTKDSTITSSGNTAAALRGIGDNVIVGLASTLGSVTTTGNQSPLVDVAGDGAVIHVRLNENETSNTDFDFAPYVTLGDESSLFQISGDNTRAFFTANQVGVRNDNGGLQSYGDTSDIIRYTMGELSTTNVDFLNSNASTFGDGSSILNLSTGNTSSADVLFGNATLDTQGANSTAILVGDTSDSSISTVILTANTITTLGENSIGVDVGSVSIIGSLTAQMNGGTIATSGANAHGARFAPSGVSDSSVGTIDLQDAMITTSGDNAFGLIVGASAVDGSAADIDIDDFNITTSGRSAVGLQAALGANVSSASSFTMSTTTISTSGDLANGAVFTSAVGSAVDTGSTVNGVVDTSVITTSGRFADALVIGENVTIYGPGAAAPIDGAGKLTVDTFEDFSATGIGSRGIQNNGVIEVTNTGITYGAGKTGRIANAGTINGAGGTAVTFAGDTDDIFELQPQAMTIGIVDGAGGTDTFILGGEGTDTFDPDLLDTQYVNFEVFEKEDLSEWTLTNDDTRSWAVRGGDLVIGTGTNLTNDGTAATVLVTEGLSSSIVDGADTIIKTRGQLIIADGAAVNSANVDVAAILVDGEVIVEDLPTVDGRPEANLSLPFRDRFEIGQSFSDVRVAGIVDTTANGAAGIQATATEGVRDLVSVSLEGSGRIQTIGADASAISGPDGTGSLITVFADEDSVIRASGARSGGIIAADGPNSVTVSMLDNASIETFGVTGYGVANVGDAGNTTVTAAGQSSITTRGAGAHAIAHLGNESAFEITLSDSVSILTTGDGASAIAGPSAQSGTTVTIDGMVQLETTGQDAAVIALADMDESVFSLNIELDDGRAGPALLSRGRDSDLVSVTGLGGNSVVLINMTGTQDDVLDLQTSGAGSDLINIQLGDLESVTTVFDGIDAQTAGSGSRGFVYNVGDNSDIQVLFENSALTTLEDMSTGVALSVGGGGSTGTLVFAGSSLATSGVGAAGIMYATGADSDAQLATDGDITTGGSDAVGIQFIGSRGGTNTAVIDGSVTTSGLRSHAVWLDEQAESVSLAATLSTVGDNAKGIGADGSVFGITTSADSAIVTTGLDADGVWIGAEAQVPIDSAVINANGAITTSGADASGIWVSTLAGDSFDDGLSESGDDLLAGTADITLAGSISTAGESGYGIAAEGTGITITVAQTGTIETSNTDGDGIWLDYGDVAVMGGMEDGTIAMNGSILTTGAMAEGIWVDRSGLSTGGTTIDVAGTIRTEGADSHGVSVFYGAAASGEDGGGIGGVGTITVSGTVEARGAGADGIRTYLDDGAATSITVEAGGDVFAPGDGDSAIYLTSLAGASGFATATINVDAATDTLPRGNVFASSGPAIAEGNDAQVPLFINTTLTVGGNVSSGGNDILAVDLGTGNDTVNVAENGFIGGSVQLGSGNDVMSVAGTVRSLNGEAVDTGAGDDEFIVLPTASILGGVDLGSGTDVLAFDGAAGTIGTVELLAQSVPFAIDVERTEKRGQGTWIFEGQDVAQDITLAPTLVLEGTAVIRSQILGTQTTNAPGGRVTGNGGLGGLANEGTFSPGENGVGTFTIANDLVLEPGSVLEIDIAANGAADLVEVGADAFLGGTLAVNGLLYPTGFPNQQDYVILTAGETVTGQFESVTDNLPDVDVTVAYNAADVTISYDRGQDESDKSIQANTVQSGLVDGRLFAEMLRRRGVLMGTTGGFASNSNVQLAQNGDPTGLGQDGKRYAVWAAAMGALADVDSRGGQVGYELGVGGIATGFDGFIPLNEGMVRVGAAFGFSAGDIDNGASGADVNTWHIGAHAVYEKDALGLSAAVSYGIQDYDIDRVIALFGAQSVTTSGDADGSVFSLSVGAKYTVYESDTFKVSPIAHVEHVSAKRDAYSETGAGILDLNVDAERFARTFVGAGVRLEAESEGAGGITYRPQFDLMYEHAFGDASAVVNSQTANIQNIAFTTRGGDQARNQVAVGTGIAMDITKRVSAHVRYDGSFADGFTSHRASAGVAISF